MGTTTAVDTALTLLRMQFRWTVGPIGFSLHGWTQLRFYQSIFNKLWLCLLLLVWMHVLRFFMEGQWLWTIWSRYSNRISWNNWKVMSWISCSCRGIYRKQQVANWRQPDLLCIWKDIWRHFIGSLTVKRVTRSFPRRYYIINSRSGRRRVTVSPTNKRLREIKNGQRRGARDRLPIARDT